MTEPYHVACAPVGRVSDCDERHNTFARRPTTPLPGCDRICVRLGLLPTYGEVEAVQYVPAPFSRAPRRLPSSTLSALLKVGGALATSLDLPEVLQTAIECAVDVLDLDTGAIYLLEDDLLVLGATVPHLSLADRRLHDVALEEHPHVQRCLREGAPVHVDDTSTAVFSPAERTLADARHLRSILYVPLVLDAQPLGAFIVGSTRGTRAFDEIDVDVSRTLSFHVSLAIANARLYEAAQDATLRLRNAYDATLEGWSMALELRDEETLGHTQRVVEMTCELAMRMGIRGAELTDVRRGATLHDIGKMVVPDSILHKQSDLTATEWEIMKSHPEHARNLIARIDYLDSAIDIPYCHHERWDGTGYPRGLRAEEIPLPARIFAVVDVFDALTSDRPYRRAWETSDALAHIQSRAGTHFDPEVVDAFMGYIIRRLQPAGQDH